MQFTILRIYFLCHWLSQRFQSTVHLHYFTWSWCIANYMKLNNSTNEFVPSQWNLTLASRLNFHNYVTYIFSQSFKLLGPVRCVTSSFLSLECLYMLYFTSTDVTMMDYSLFQLILVLNSVLPFGNCWTSSSCSGQQCGFYTFSFCSSVKLSICCRWPSTINICCRDVNVSGIWSVPFNCIS